MTKTYDLEKRKGNLKIEWRHKLVFNLHSKNQVLTIAAKSYAKAKIKDFWSSTILLEFLTFSHIYFVTDCKIKKNHLNKST